VPHILTVQEWGQKLLDLDRAAAQGRDDVLIAALADPGRWRKDTIRAAAAQTAARFRREAAAPSVVPLLSDLDPMVRMAAVRALAELQCEPAVAALAQLLRDEDHPKVRQWCIVALGALGGSAALRALELHLEDATLVEALLVVQALWKNATPEAHAVVLAQVRRGRPRQRAVFGAYALVMHAFRRSRPGGG